MRVRSWVGLVFGLLADGMTIDEIVADYPLSVNQTSVPRSPTVPV